MPFHIIKDMQMFHFHMRNENFTCKINFHSRIYHFTSEIYVLYTNISHVKLWTTYFTFKLGIS